MWQFYAAMPSQKSLDKPILVEAARASRVAERRCDQSLAQIPASFRADVAADQPDADAPLRRDFVDGATDVGNATTDDQDPC